MINKKYKNNKDNVMSKKRSKLLFFSLFVASLLVGLSNYEKPETDPFVQLKVSPMSYVDDLADEPLFSQQFHFNHINRGDVYDTYRGEGVTVAIIDSGLNTTHVDFFDGSYTNIVPESAYIEETGEYFSNINIQTVAEYGRSIIEDPVDIGHGTNVAGTIGALVNGLGTAGVSPKVNLMILKVNYYFTEVWEAICYAADNGADIINMSIGSYNESFYDGFGEWIDGWPGTDTFFQSAIDYAYDKGVTLIASAGNEKTSVPSYPAANNNVIGVGALARNSSTNISSYSNYGTDNVDLVAPGSVYVADVGSSTSYRETQGTSFSAPIVASAAALYKSKHPDATPDQIEQRLKGTAYDLGDAGDDSIFGSGRLDLTALMSDVAVTGVELSPSSLSLNVGDSSQVVANVLPSHATNQNVTYFSEDDSIVTINEDTGVVNAISEGSTRVGVITEDGLFESYTDVTVTNIIPVTGVSFVLDEITTINGSNGITQYNVTPENATNKEVTFTSSNTNVIAIYSTGYFSAVGIGSSTIRVTTVDGGFFDELLIVVRSAVTYEFELILDDSGFKKDYTFKEPLALETLSATFRDMDGIIHDLTGYDLSLVSGSTAVLGTSSLLFDYSGEQATVDITVTNIGSSQAGDGPEDRFNASEQANAYYDYFMDVTHQQCLVRNVETDTWDMLTAEYEAMIQDAKDLLMNSEYSDFHARYNMIIQVYRYYDFINGVSPSGLNSIFRGSTNVGLIIWSLIATIGLLSISTPLVFYKHKKIKV
jgi:hypothetical protein